MANNPKVTFKRINTAVIQKIKYNFVKQFSLVDVVYDRRSGRSGRYEFS